jgi:hypothetical protein
MVNHTKRYSSILIVDTKNKRLTHKGMIPKDIYKKCRLNIPPQENDGYATVKHFSLTQMKEMLNDQDFETYYNYVQYPHVCMNNNKIMDKLLNKPYSCLDDALQEGFEYKSIIMDLIGPQERFSWI